LAVERIVRSLARPFRDKRLTQQDTDTCETRATIECYVDAAIVNAREALDTDQKWLTWRSLDSRSRIAASRRQTAHRMARQSATVNREMADYEQDGTEKTSTRCRSRNGGEMAAWAAGLALVTASVRPT